MCDLVPPSLIGGYIWRRLLSISGFLIDSWFNPAISHHIGQNLSLSKTGSLIGAQTNPAISHWWKSLNFSSWVKDSFSLVLYQARPFLIGWTFTWRRLSPVLNRRRSLWSGDKQFVPHSQRTSWAVPEKDRTLFENTDLINKQLHKSCLSTFNYV